MQSLCFHIREGTYLDRQVPPQRETRDNDPQLLRVLASVSVSVSTSVFPELMPPERVDQAAEVRPNVPQVGAVSIHSVSIQKAAFAFGMFVGIVLLRLLA